MEPPKTETLKISESREGEREKGYFGISMRSLRNNNHIFIPSHIQGYLDEAQPNINEFQFEQFVSKWFHWIPGEG